jgi:hypothetical protein
MMNTAKLINQGEIVPTSAPAAREIPVKAPPPVKAVDPAVEFELADNATSPARDIQLRLAESLEEAGEADGERRWSPRSTLLFAGAASVALWAGIALIARMVL